MATPKLKLGNDKWATKQRSLLAYNDEGNKFKSLPFNVERLSGGSYVGRNGLIQYAATEEPRIDFTNNTKGGLLLEPQRTNLIQRSEEFDNSYFGKYNTSITPNAVNSPNGSLNADKIVENSANNIHSLDSQFHSATGNLSASVFVKKDERKYIRFMITQLNPTIDHYAVFDLENKSVYSTSSGVIADINEFQDDWIRIKISVNSTGNLARMSIVLQTVLQSTPQAYQGDGTSGLYLWGGQLEAGDYSTSYIPTAGSAATRIADLTENDSIPGDLINSTEGTLFIDFEYLYETTSSSSTDANRDIFVLGTSADISEGISIDNYRSQFRVFVQGSGMTTQSIGNNSTGAAQPNTRYKLAVKYKTGDCKAYLNGSLLGSGTGTVNFVTDLNGIFFSYNSSTRPYKNQKRVYDLQYFDTALTDAELQTLTTL